MKLVLLSSNTQHHWYFINKLKNYGIIFDSIIFETTFIKAKFDTSSPWEKKQLNFEKKRWKKLVKPTEKIKYVKSIFKKYDIKNKTLNEINILTSSIVSLISKLSITKKNKEEFSKYINELSSRTN